METRKYKVRTIRVEDKVWKGFKKQQKKSEFSWNLFIKSLLK